MGSNITHNINIFFAEDVKVKPIKDIFERQRFGSLDDAKREQTMEFNRGVKAEKILGLLNTALEHQGYLVEVEGGRIQIKKK
jgi:hypothetical protein